VDGIERRTPASLSKAEVLLLHYDKVVECSEVSCGRIAFAAAYSVERLLILQKRQRPGKLLDRCCYSGAVRASIMIALGAHQHGTTVCNFRGNHDGCNLC